MTVYNYLYEHIIQKFGVRKIFFNVIEPLLLANAAFYTVKTIIL